MNRLHAEWNRLFLVDGQPADAQGRTRALVLEVACPPGWSELAQAWRGVQADLDMPAPAIALSGADGLQLWFSLAQPVEADRAASFLEGLRRRYLANVRPAQVRPAPSAPDPSRLPPRQVAGERWSAFVAADLAPVFDDEPWIDHPVGDDAQADLLARLETTKPACFEAAWIALGCGAGAQLAPQHQALAVQASGSRALSAPVGSAQASQAANASLGDPRRFLLQVMNDASVDMALRIEAAKALLPYGEGSHER